MFVGFFFFQAEDGIRDLVRSRGLGDVYKRQVQTVVDEGLAHPILIGRPAVVALHAERAGLRLKAVSYTPLTLPTSDLV